MKKSTFILLSILGASHASIAIAAESGDPNDPKPDLKVIEALSTNPETVLIVKSLVERKALYYDREDSIVKLDLSKLTTDELSRFIKSSETIVDLENREISLDPAFSDYLLNKKIITPEEIGEDSVNLNDLLNNVSPNLRDAEIQYMRHSFA